MKILSTNGYEIEVDDADFDRVSKLNWCVRKMAGTNYLVASTTIYMHRLILDAPTGKGMVVDHINGDGLDNRKANLRLCSRADNAKNRGKNHNNKSGYKGVFKLGETKYIARIKDNGKNKHLGTFSTAEDAYVAYTTAAKVLHGEFFNPGERLAAGRELGAIVPVPAVPVAASQVAS